MSEESFVQSLRELQEVFDRSFAVARTEPGEQLESLLAVRVAGHPYALRVGELAGLLPSRRTVAVPSPVRALVGLAGVRSALVPVYSLGVLLGRAPDSGRWLALCGIGEPIGLAFEGLDGRVELRRSSVHASSGGSSTPHVREVARVSGALRPVVSIASILQALKDGLLRTKEG